MLMLGTVLVYLPAWRLDFVNYDDDAYVTNNPNVAAGLSWQGIAWALTRAHAANWHPLTWWSHMLDCQVYGLHPAGHHLTNVLLHALNALLVFVVLNRMTGSPWRSATVAGLFAWHPTHVESVAWVAERKDVLSGLFFLLALWSYNRYVERSKVRFVPTRDRAAASPEPPKPVTQDGRPGVSYYALTLLCFCLGLMSKPMVVTLPLVLLLLDYWPLRRVVARSSGTPVVRLAGWKPLLMEKLPFFGLAAGSCLITLLTQRRAGTVASLALLPLDARVANAVVAYVQYLGKLFWPTNLAVFYPRVEQRPAGQVVGSLLLLFGLSALAWWQRRERPYLLIGWLWFLGMLVPVVGLVQVGGQSIADRYTYLPSIGLFVAVVWSLGGLAAGWKRQRLVLGVCASGLLLVLAVQARAQLAVWKDSETLFRHALAVTENNFVAFTNLGMDLARKQDYAAAQQAYESALRIRPDLPTTWNALGIVHLAQQRPDQARTAYEMALRLRPGYVDALINVGIVAGMQSQWSEAVDAFSQALRLKPDSAAAHYQLASVLAQRGDTQSAIQHYRAALRISPDFPEALNNLAWILAAEPRDSVRDGAEAVKLAERACALTDYRTPLMIGTLGAAYAESGRFAEAVAMAEKARALAEELHEPELAAKNLMLLGLYRSGQPYREKP